ncbi:protein DOWNSTREAM OF FLC [Citrus sinensis]|nr:protein DOWNSTREAM OF FLC [Citrus sinensis]
MPPYSIHTLPQPCAYIIYITLSSASQFSFPLLFSNFAFFFPIAAMARLLLLFALVALLLVELVNAGDPFHIRGRVYCDTCRCGFETSATTYIQGARVRIECKDRNSLNLKYSVDGDTDSTGTYNIHVDGDHQDQICYVKLISSSLADCKTAYPGCAR